MKTTLKFGVVSGFLVIGAFFLFSKSAEANVAAGEMATSPRSLYVSNCARCHGSDGKSQTAQGKKLDADNISGGGISTAKAVRIITSGKGKMPGFGRKLTPAQISSIAAYIKSL